MSHSAKDAQYIPWIRWTTDYAGAFLYVAEENIAPGRDLPSKIQMQIQSSNVVIWLVTENSMASAIVNQEVGYAIGLKKYVIPIVIGDAVPKGMSLNTEYIRLDPMTHDICLQNLGDYLKNMVDQDRNATWIGQGALGLGAVALWYLLREKDEEEE